MRTKKSKTVESVRPLPATCLEQAEICREQARDAVRLKRFKAALGLFSTASALCKRAYGFQDADDQVRAAAFDAMCQIDSEVATYAEFFQSMERPTLSTKLA